ncbi:MAG: CsgG/HfaB family protein [Sphingomonadales bacterium]
MFIKKAVFLIALIAMVAVTPFSVHAQDGELQAVKNLKQKIAVGRFSNETRYGRSLLRDQDLDPLGKQASDIMTAYLTHSDHFLVFERTDVARIEREQTRGTAGDLVSVDTLIVGSVVEFGTNVDGQRGFFNKSKVQRAHAKVAVRLVDVRTGLVFHSAVGQGEATTETRTVLGMGSTSRYDGTLTDKAISVAIEDMIEDLVSTIQARPWRTDILQVQGDQVFVSGGESQGLKVGDRFAIMREGEVIKSRQTGFDITLPGEKLGEIEIVSLFGETEVAEGAVARLISGTADGDPGQIYVAELQQAGR